MSPRWVDALFARFASIWPRHWSDLVAVADLGMLKSEWANGLAGMSGEQIKMALEYHRERSPWPPAIAEFISAGKPSSGRKKMSDEALFYHAVEQLRRRASGEDAWEGPEVYWAAMRIGSDMTSIAYRDIKSRWEAALTQATRDVEAGILARVIPKHVVSLPAPVERHEPRQEASAEDVARHLSDMKAALDRPRRTQNNIDAGLWTQDDEGRFFKHAQFLGVPVENVFTGEIVEKPPTRWPSYVAMHLCEASGCQQLGSLSRSTTGGGPWLCAKHFFDR